MLDSIKDILKKAQSVFIVVENNKPSFVILPFEEYQHLLGGAKKEPNPEGLAKVDKKAGSRNPDTGYELLEKINKDIEVWKASQTPSFEEPEDDQDIRIENVPY